MATSPRRRKTALSTLLLPRRFSHAAQFFTVGHAARTTWARRGDPDYVPYADHNGLWERGWGGFHEVLAAHWQPFLDGEVSRGEALAEIAAAYAEAKQGGGEG
jgi:hypothetical protein